MFVTSQRFPVRHAFSTRIGGVSRGPHASLNLGLSVGDDPERVAENARRLARALELSPGQLASVNQVHGDRLLEVTGAAAGEVLPPALAGADGLFTRERGVALCIRTADCVPVLLFAPDAGAAAAVHAGWRGAAAAIAGRAAQALAARFGARPSTLFAAIGPSIRSCCYEVGEEVAAVFRLRFGEAVVRGGEGRAPHLDLPAACRLALLEAGVDEDHIDVLPSCTSCDSMRFFSHRRDRGRTGRHLSLVAL
jgi:YfiH family protein